MSPKGLVAPAPSTRGATPSRAARVLVVDDEETIRITLAEILKGAGYVVREAESAETALALFREEKPDLVMLDLLMPGTDGFAACRAIRNLHDGATVPIVMATGLDDDASIARAFEVGATDFITKPIQPTILVRRTQQVLRWSRTFATLRRNENRLSTAQRIARVGDWEVDLETGEETWSEQALAAFGIEELPGSACLTSVLARIDAEERESFASALDAAVKWHHGFSRDIRVVVEDDRCRFVHAIGQVVDGADGTGRRLAVTVQDVTERKSAEERIRVLGYFDGLTRLANRQHLMECVTRELIASRRAARLLAILFLDLDRFKLVNDTLGHRVGDLLLVEVANRLRSLVRATDELARNSAEDEGSVVGRLGGDEFIVCLKGMRLREDAARVARRIQEAFREPFLADGHELTITPSIGISVSPDDGDGVDDLLRCADIAMYCAKREQSGGFRYFDASMNTDALRRLSVEAALRRAIDHGEFELHFQPQVDASTLVPNGLEALIRWRHAEFGLVPPNEFIAIADECGLSERLGIWVIDRACRFLSTLRSAGRAAVPVAVNVSARHVQYGDLVGHVRRALETYRLPAESIEIEITERVFMERLGASAEKLRELRAAGVRIAIDDFGTGYSCLAYLSHLPVDRLKIDKSFVDGVDRDHGPERSIVTAIATMARGLSLGLVAEGVERDSQVTVLRELGCDALQGFLLGRPIPERETIERLARGVAVG